MAIKGSTKVLIVDDMLSARLAVKQLLNKMGLKKTDEVGDGEKAWEKLNQEEFGLVICELKVVKLSGLELLTAMRGTPSLAKVPFVLMTGDSQREIIEKATQAGVNGFLVKPFSQQTLTEVLIKIFN